MILRLEAPHHRLEILPSDGKAVVGRSDDCDYLLDDKSISRRHMEVFFRVSKGWTIRDLESSKGTFVNNESVLEPVEIFNGDLLKLGNITFTVMLEGGASRVRKDKGTKVLATVGATPAHPNPEVRSLEEADAGIAMTARASRTNVEVEPEISPEEEERLDKRRLALTRKDDELMKQLTPILMVIGGLLVFWLAYRFVVSGMGGPAPVPPAQKETPANVAPAPDTKY